MRDLFKLCAEFGEMPLNRLSVLGAHDAASGHIHRTDIVGQNLVGHVSKTKLIGCVVPNYTVKIADSQGTDICRLCQCGVRGFDLRIDSDADRNFRIEHSYLGDRFEVVLSQFEKFLATNPHEIIFLDFICSPHILANEELKSAFLTLVHSILGENIFPEPKPSTTLNEFWSAEKNIAVFCPFNQPEFIPKADLSWIWPIAKHPGDVIRHIKSQLELHENHEIKQPFFWLQCQTTPTPLQAFGGLFFSSTSLLTFANESNKEVLDFLSSIPKNNPFHFYGIDNCNSFFGRNFFYFALSQTVSRIKMNSLVSSSNLIPQNESEKDEIAIPTEQNGERTELEMQDSTFGVGSPQLDEVDSEFHPLLSSNRTFVLTTDHNDSSLVFVPEFNEEGSKIVLKPFYEKQISKNQLWRSEGYSILHVSTNLYLSCDSSYVYLSKKKAVPWIFVNNQLTPLSLPYHLSSNSKYISLSQQPIHLESPLRMVYIDMNEMKVKTETE